MTTVKMSLVDIFKRTEEELSTRKPIEEILDYLFENIDVHNNSANFMNFYLGNVDSFNFYANPDDEYIEELRKYPMSTLKNIGLDYTYHGKTTAITISVTSPILNRLREYVERHNK